jgi:soluble lytic murein transglycosylase-like protein
MRKTCLLFVLTFVSVFSVSAQTEYKQTNNPNSIENISGYSANTNTENESVETISKIPETGSLTEQAIPTSVNTALPLISLIAANKRLLGKFSTGNREIDSYIEDFSAIYNIDPLLIYAQMKQESSFKLKATSHKGASGLMQLVPETARRFGVKNIYNPKQNIKAGVKYMRWLLDEFGGDTHLALAAYNAGEGTVKKYGNKIPPYRETQKYVAGIMARYDEISN